MTYKRRKYSHGRYVVNIFWKYRTTKILYHENNVWLFWIIKTLSYEIIYQCTEIIEGFICIFNTATASSSSLGIFTTNIRHVSVSFILGLHVTTGSTTFQGSTVNVNRSSSSNLRQPYSLYINFCVRENSSMIWSNNVDNPLHYLGYQRVTAFSIPYNSGVFTKYESIYVAEATMREMLAVFWLQLGSRIKYWMLILYIMLSLFTFWNE